MPNQHHVDYFVKACGVSRFAYNWALTRWQDQYKRGLKPTYLTLKQEFNHIKDERYPWIREVTKCAPEQAFIDLNQSYKNFFGKTHGYPTKRKRGKNDSFYLANDQFDLRNGRYIRVPKLGLVKMREKLRFEGKILSARIKRVADMWFVCILINTETTHQPHQHSENQTVVGIDVGLNKLLQLSTDETHFYLAPKPLKEYLHKLKVLQRRLSRKQKGSANRHKARMKVACMHYKIACIRKDYLNKVTTFLAATYKYIGVESLKVKNMVRNHKLARAISDVGWSTFTHMLKYKLEERGGKLIEIPTFFPSSKMCSGCHNIKATLSLADRTYTCTECGLVIDRDYNAALNIAAKATNILFSTEGFSGSNACGHNNLFARAA